MNTEQQQDAAQSAVPEATTPQFKVGDEVITHRFVSEIDGTDFNDKGMAMYVGDKGAIKGISENGNYLVHGWWWIPSAVELAPAEPAPTYKTLAELRAENASLSERLESTSASCKSWSKEANELRGELRQAKEGIQRLEGDLYHANSNLSYSQDSINVARQHLREKEAIIDTLWRVIERRPHTRHGHDRDGREIELPF